MRSASWLRSGISVSSNDSTSRATCTGSPSSSCSSPSTRTDGRDSEERYNVEAPRADETRSSRSSPDSVGSSTAGGGISERIGLREMFSTTAGCGSYSACRRGGGTARGSGGSTDAAIGAT